MVLLLHWLPSNDMGKCWSWDCLGGHRRKKSWDCIFVFCFFVQVSTREAVRVGLGQTSCDLSKLQNKKRAGKGLRNLISSYRSLSQCRNQFCLSHAWLMCAYLFLGMFLHRWSPWSPLSNLLQCCRILTIKELSLTSNWNFSGCSWSSYPPWSWRTDYSLL